MAQLRYDYTTPSNVPGGIADISCRTIVSRTNVEEEDGIKLGVGVVRGKTAGKNVKYPAADSKAEEFEGVVVDGGLTPVGDDGKVLIRKGAACNIMTHGKVWVRCAAAAEPAYGDVAYLVTDGDEKGFFTFSGDGESTKVELSAKFLGAKENDIALIELF